MHRFNYNEPMSIESITQTLGDLAISFGEDDENSMVRIHYIFDKFYHYNYFPNELRFKLVSSILTLL